MRMIDDTDIILYCVDVDFAIRTKIPYRFTLLTYMFPKLY